MRSFAWTHLRLHWSKVKPSLLCLSDGFVVASTTPCKGTRNSCQVSDRSPLHQPFRVSVIVLHEIMPANSNPRESDRAALKDVKQRLASESDVVRIVAIEVLQTESVGCNVSLTISFGAESVEASHRNCCHTIALKTNRIQIK